MKYNKVALGTLLALCSTAVLAQSAGNSNPAPKGYTLEQVVLVSRHGLRAPLATGDSTLGKSSAYAFPAWETKGSWLTPKGQVLEAYFGHYIKDWLVQNGLFEKNVCPKAEQVTVYTNSKQRTIATGEFFAAGAFPGCNLPVENREAIDTMDYTFSPVIRDGSEAFKKAGLKAMEEEASSTGIAGMNKELKPAYDLLNKIVDYKDSPACKETGICDISKIPTTLSFNKDKEPGINGPLRLGTIISDAFILQYYDGYPMEDVAWGKIKNNKEWLELAQIKDKYGEVLFGAPLVAKHVAKPLLDYVDKTMKTGSEEELTVLVGHDSNVVSLLSALNVKPYVLPDTFENTPIGGKIAIERWQSPKGQELVRLEYIYQTSDQIRNLVPLNLKTPAQHVTLEMADCPTDKHGFCSFETFKEKLAKF
ncbi:bifunctional glucose-1-phosphatase/inositol phosphatase [Vibrio panuliri]|uniref:Bifunctional glucose-1-phosphatase/inositol phosphatase n=1 Tax=Vibrio panuliri TaxID=1381081 RepID=A0ABX3FCV5_9VIBR|nr:bifunctional glucose-1-phosphatase/inositol phosphatase [Vibrio panuliri]KAB1457533.1 bifunctional glucose-1-phosphatase/inositol phosphatase [Vibrio panuliri]OLQ87689.1 bifunctional glucose-1-phosphatase/inositol phosphatase [Vibrio panuliri]